MKKTFGAVAALFGLMATLLLGVASAQATTPPSHCNNGTWLGVAAIVCEIDINDDGVLNGNDVKVIIPISRVLNGNEINILTAALDDINVDVSDLVKVTSTTVSVLNYFSPSVIITGPLVVLPCGCH